MAVFGSFASQKLEIGDLLVITYNKKARIAKCIGLRDSKYRIKVKFFDDGEERQYPAYSNRIRHATPRDIAKWGTKKRQVDWENEEI